MWQKVPSSPSRWIVPHSLISVPVMCPDKKRQPDQPEANPGRTLLLVDDEENITASLVRLLRRDGYTILRANSGQGGLDLLTQHKVGVIISDQRMLGMTGVEFLRSEEHTSEL